MPTDPPQPPSDTLPAPRLPVAHAAPPYRGRVLVVAPHPDDEVAGPGGVLVHHARAGDPVAVLFVTSGVNGDPERARGDPSSYVALRRREAREAAVVLGVGETTFWDFPDNCVVTRADLQHVTALLAQALADARPDVIYAPHPGECHGDHRVVGLAVEEARRRAAPDARLLQYEIWSALAEPDLLVDCTATWPVKQEALRRYPSQLAHTDIAGATDGLARYRAILLGPGGADGSRRAEAFREVP